MLAEVFINNIKIKGDRGMKSIRNFLGKLGHIVLERVCDYLGHITFGGLLATLALIIWMICYNNGDFIPGYVLRQRTSLFIGITTGIFTGILTGLLLNYLNQKQTSVIEQNSKNQYLSSELRREFKRVVRDMIDSLRYIEIQLNIYIENKGVLTKSMKIGLLYSCKELDKRRYEVQNDYKISWNKDTEHQNELEIMVNNITKIVDECFNIVCLVSEVQHNNLSEPNAEECCKIIRQARGIYMMKLYSMLKKLEYIVEYKI